MSFTSGYKVNVNTDYEFTVSNETINEIVTGGGITEQDIANYCYTALIDNRIYSLHSVGKTASQVGGYDAFIAEYCPYYIERGNIYPLLNENMTSSHDEIYERNFLVWVGTIYPNTDNEKYGTFLVMDIKDIKKWYMDFNTGCYIKTNVSSTITKSGVTTPTVGYTGECYYYNDNSVQRPVIKSTSDETVNASLHILNVFILNNEYWIGELNPSSNGMNKTFDAMNNWNSFTPSYLRGYLDHENGHIYQAGTTDYAGIPKLYNLKFPDARDADLVSYPESDNGVLIYTRCDRSALPSYSCMYAKDLNTVLTWSSWCGLKFKFGDTFYKPIIEQGVIVGYTDNMETPSEWDDMTNVTGNNISPVPPTPSAPTGDIETDMPLAYIGGTAGMVDFIKINESGLASADDISDAISRFDITTIGKDLLRNFVAFKCYAVLDIDDSVVRAIKVAGHTLKDENDKDLQGEYIGSIKPVDFSVGTIEHLYNDFRDYAPYTRIQMYVPFCGWFDLPSWCMGKEITGTMFTDLYNGTVKAVIYASRTVVAEVGGCCAFDIPFAAESTGMKAGAVISSALNTVAMTGATIAAPNIATGIAAVSSAANFISAANSNGTTLKGVMGDGSNTNGLLHVYIKTTRPNAPNGKKEIPDKYKHEYGIPCFKELKLTSGDGYTQIMDANITGAMTDREKQMIIDGFRHGLIL